MDDMYVVLRWDKYPTWPSVAVGSIVNNITEAHMYAELERRRAVAQGGKARFTVHKVEWPPVGDFIT